MHEHKQCCKCGQLLPFESFAKDKTKKDGRHTKCKACVKAYKAENKEAISAQRKEYREKNREAIREYMVNYRPAYRKKNGSKLIAQSIEWAKKNPERRKMIVRQNRVMHPEVSRLVTRRRRARAAGSGGSHTKSDILDLLKKQRWKCACCRASVQEGYHVDHIKPLSKGGDNGKLNLQILCSRCNVSKGAKDPLQFMQSRGFLC